MPVNNHHFLLFNCHPIHNYTRLDFGLSGCLFVPRSQVQVQAFYCQAKYFPIFLLSLFTFFFVQDRLLLLMLVVLYSVRSKKIINFFPFLVSHTINPWVGLN